jgi:hypothetical protein
MFSSSLYCAPERSVTVVLRKGYSYAQKYGVFVTIEQPFGLIVSSKQKISYSAKRSAFAFSLASLEPETRKIPPPRRGRIKVGVTK